MKFYIIIFLLLLNMQLFAGIKALQKEKEERSVFEQQMNPDYLKIKLEWKPKESIQNIDSLDFTIFDNVIFKVNLSDARISKEYIAVCITTADNRYVSTSTDIGDWCTEYFKETLNYYEIKHSDTLFSYKLTGDIREFFVEEDATYNGMIRVMLKLYDKEDNLVWKAPIIGRNKNWGTSFDYINYQETFSAVVINLVQNFLKNSILHDKLKQ